MTKNPIGKIEDIKRICPYCKFPKNQCYELQCRMNYVRPKETITDYEAGYRDGYDKGKNEKNHDGEGGNGLPPG